MLILNTNLCRLCSGSINKSFELKILQNYVINYHICDTCLSLQSDPPYWLEEAYKNSNISNLDTGAASRIITNLTTVLLIIKIFNINNILDFGGGDGLLCRMLRDHNANCFVSDKFANPVYAQGFTYQDFETPHLVTSFEVIEHFANPSKDLDNIFLLKSNFILLSTEVYSGQKADWWYLSPDSGQHIFFYSRDAFKYIALKYNYELIFINNYILFYKTISFMQKFKIKLFFNNIFYRFLKAYLLTRETSGVWRDYLFQTKKSNS